MRKFYPLTHHLKLYQKFAPNLTSNFCSLDSPFLHSLNRYFESFKLHSKRRLLASLLRSLTKQHSLSLCYQIHTQIILSGFESDTCITNLLLGVYVKIDFLCAARQLFDKLPKKNLFPWSSMVSMYSRHGLNKEALALFLDFRRYCNASPNDYILTSVIRVCSQLVGDGDGDGDGGDMGKLMHGFVVKNGFGQDAYVGTSLVDFYTKSGDIDEARMIFDGLPYKSTVTWTTIITGYIKTGRSVVSLQLFSQMREFAAVPDRYVLSSVLSACLTLDFVEGGRQIHGHVLRRGIEIDHSFVNVMIDFYVKCGKVDTARKLFDQMADRNVISWTAMIAGYMQNSLDDEAVELFVEMIGSGRHADGFACTSLLTSCGSLKALELGRQVHAYSIKANVECDLFVKNGLICMYAKCDCLNDARRVFDVMINHNVVSFNALIEGYSRNEQLCEAISLFHEMRQRMLPLSLFTFVSLLGASAALSALELSKQIHAMVIRYGVSLELFVSSALIDVYSKCSCLIDARLAFDEMHQKDIVVWNAMFFGYTQQSENEKALKLYSELQISEQRPDDFTFAALMTAANNLASLQHGQQFHSQMIKMGLGFDAFVVNSLVDMYAKCGSFKDAYEAFVSSSRRDAVCWNSMISTYAHHGQAKKAILIFEKMIEAGMKPDSVTFVGLLSACSHAGLVKEGLHYFKSMPKFGIQQESEHYACVVSLLGRAGKLYEAKEFIEKLPIKLPVSVWKSLLSACQSCGNLELGKYAAETAISMDLRDSGLYTLLSNIFASKGMWESVKQMRERMDAVGIVKEAGHSWIEINNEAHVFIARDRTHRETQLIYSVVDYLIMQIKEAGYLPDATTLLLND